MTTVGRQEWLRKAAHGIAIDFEAKYEAGAREHQGDLGDVPMDTLLKELYQEQLDSLAYLAEIKRRLDGNGMVVIPTTSLHWLFRLATTEVEMSKDDHSFLTSIEDILIKHKLL